VRELLLASPASIDDILLRQGLAGPDVDAIVTACAAAGVRYRFVPAADLDRLFPGNHQGVLARLTESKLVELENVLEATGPRPCPWPWPWTGSRTRAMSARCAARSMPWAAADSSCPSRGRPARAPGGQGRSRHPGPAARGQGGHLARALDTAAEAGFSIIGAAGDDSRAENGLTATPDFPVILVLGNEEEASGPACASVATCFYRIPQARPLDSLNVAQAGAILLGRLVALRHS
jgi:23S rRNA (guanosine2251-2'-O)-methyltransferase